MLHCGDVVAPSTLHVVRQWGLPMHVIHGNNAGDVYHMVKLAADPANLVQFHGQDAQLSFSGLRIFMVHYPHYARAMALTGEWDIVCHGHNHHLSIQQVENIKKTTTWLVEPGSVGGVSAPPTYILADLAAMSFTPCELRRD